MRHLGPRRLFNTAADVQTFLGLPRLARQAITASVFVMVPLLTVVTFVTRNLYWIAPSVVMGLYLAVVVGLARQRLGASSQALPGKAIVREAPAAVSASPGGTETIGMAWDGGVTEREFGVTLWVARPKNDRRIIAKCMVRGSGLFNRGRWEWLRPMMVAGSGRVTVNFPEDFPDGPSGHLDGHYEYEWLATEDGLVIPGLRSLERVRIGEFEFDAPSGTTDRD